MAAEADTTEWGRLFRAHRLHAGMSQEQLARVSGVSVRGIRMIENGTRRPRASTVKALSDAMRLSEQDGIALLEAAQPQARTDLGPRDPGAGPTVVPRQLPPTVAGFVGREAALRSLDALLGADGSAIGIVTGTAGVGKTTLAVTWGHRNTDEFPDGQIYVDLQGFGPNGTAVTPDDAVRTFLDALGVAPARVPRSLSGQVGLYRSLVADKRILVLLDNARDVSQARPLLPGGTDCVTVITSRDQLTGLVATEAARPVLLDVMTPPEARGLLARRIGGDQVLDDPASANDIIASCSRLPLALALVAARAAVRPGFRLDALAAELRDEHRGLTSMVGPRSATDVRAVFSWSYRAVGDEAARLFRLSALHPGPELSVHAAAALTATAPATAAALLTELASANLLTESAADRYRCHDLLRAYAFDLAEEDDDVADRDAASRRMLDHYLHSALAAERLLNPLRTPIDVDSPDPASVPRSPIDRADALAWFAREHQNLCAAILRATGGHDRHAWQLVWSMTTHLSAGFRPDWIGVLRLGLAATERLGDAPAHHRIRLALGNAHIRIGDIDEAREHLSAALEHGRPRTRANAHLALAFCAERQGDPATALKHSELALDLFDEDDCQVGRAKAFNSIGWHRAKLGDFEGALKDCRRALTLLHDLGEPHGEAETWDSLGYIHHHRGRFSEAIVDYLKAVELHTELGNNYNLAKVLLNLSDTHAATGDRPSAVRDLRKALSILESIGHPDATDVRERLRDLDP